ncbi:hypothetical protein VOLCADRAFT_88884 [Volvox carteri f. nagariensis]|uniref:Uncharacterized protein n=1 Tax=Volvox carteri f. nagariensis TaxID=3068 RepID=D8TQ76_VOLCA|nr:uncharacterized protein VOLCADRAFT_88884 [Volvox carteri f. nagariensis]EFJ50486.1 hypothetical protein VOLCADRAFT_88884 [Volvox carteri f. nagariensis]|eukprot:XP_002948611.1 hypothetical protein VOLCADRAFT_88884 [Volvox carteri f. nagariensis]
MSSKRQRLAVEMATADRAALPAVCYLPSITGAGGAASPSEEPISLTKRLKFNLHAKQRLGSSIQLAHASLGDIEFVGRSDGEENKGMQHCCYALAAYRPGDKKLQLMHVAGDHLFRLDTRLQGLIYAPTGAGADEGEGARERRRAAARKLVDEFGSTRRRRQMTAREAGVVVADKISGGDAVQELLGNVAARGQEGGMTKEEVFRKAFAQRTVPPHNPAATNAADAYPLNLLLGRPGGEAAAAEDGASLVGDLHVSQIHQLAEDEEELDKARAKELVGGGEVQAWGRVLVHPYVLSRLGALRALKNQDTADCQARARHRARYLALLAALLRLLSRPVLSVKGEGIMGLSRELRLRESLTEFVLERFYVRTQDVLRGVRYERPDAQKQLLLSYILAVAVVAEDGFLDKPQFEDLREALKLDAAKLAAALQELGCVTRSVKLVVERDNIPREISTYTASLLRQGLQGGIAKTLEESFPVIKTARGKGKGGK